MPKSETEDTAGCRWLQEVYLLREGVLPGPRSLCPTVQHKYPEKIFSGNGSIIGHGGSLTHKFIDG